MNLQTANRAARDLAVGLAVFCTFAGCSTDPASTRVLRRGPEREDPARDLSLDHPWTGWDDAREPVRPLLFARDWTVKDAEGRDLPLTVDKRSSPKEKYAATVPFDAGSGPVRATFRPLQPLPVPEPFDTLEFWAEWEPQTESGPDNGDPVRLILWIEDAGGTTLRVPWTLAQAQGWQLLRHALAKDYASPTRFPARFPAVEVEVPAGRRGRLHLTGFTAYLRSRTALDNRAPDFRKTGAGISENDEALVFPFFSRAIEPARLRLPANRDGAARIEQEDAALRIHTGSGTNRTEWTFDAARPMSGFTFRFANGQTLRWTGPAMTGPGAQYPGRLLALRQTPGRVFLEYSDGLTILLEAEGSGLALEYADANRQVREVQWPWLPARALRLPEGSPAVVLAPGYEAAARKVCLGFSWDPYASRASEGPVSIPEARADRVRYLPTADGRLPVLRERFLLSVSPDLRDHLPGHDAFRPAGLGPGDVLLVTADRSAAEAAIARLGLSGVRILQAFPASGGPLSFDLHPIALEWTREAVLQRGDGNWMPGAEPATTRMKPATRFQAWREEIQAQPPNAAGPCLLRLPLLPLAEWTDFDIRLAGAGSFRSSLDACVSAWRDVPDGATPPLLALEDDAGSLAPWADLLLLSDRQGLALAGKAEGRINPDRLSRKPGRIGVGSFAAWREAYPALPEEEVLRRYLATQIAHDVAGRVPEPERAAPATLAHACHALQSLRARIAGQKADWHGIERDGRLLDETSALLDDAPADRHYRHYPDGLEIWVNLSETADWDIATGANRWRIPPGGWVAAGPEYLNVSVLAEGARIDYIESDRLRFFRGAGPMAAFRGFSGTGPVLLRFDPGAEATDYTESGRVRIPDRDWAGFLSSPWECLSAAGEPLGRASVAAEGESLVLSGPPGTRRYVRSPGAGATEETRK